MAKGAKGPRQRHVPQRTCVACRQTRAKRDLVRIVRTLTGEVEIDPTGKRPGRGAYLCRNQSCWELALKKSIVEHALQTTMSPENRAALEEQALALAAASTA